MTFWPRRVRDRVAAAIFVVLAIASAVCVMWVMRQGFAV